MNKATAVRARDRLQSRGFAHVVRWTIVLALWTLLISMANGRFGISNFVQLRENADLLRDRNMQLSIENQMLGERIHKLEKSPAAQRLFVVTASGKLSDPRESVVHLGPVPTHPLSPRDVAMHKRQTGRLAQNSAAPEVKPGVEQNIRF